MGGSIHVDVAGRHLTVFNSQSLLQVGGRWNEAHQTLDRPFQVGTFQTLEIHPPHFMLLPSIIGIPGVQSQDQIIKFLPSLSPPQHLLSFSS